MEEAEEEEEGFVEAARGARWGVPAEARAVTPRARARARVGGRGGAGRGRA